MLLVNPPIFVFGGVVVVITDTCPRVVDNLKAPEVLANIRPVLANTFVFDSRFKALFISENRIDPVSGTATAI